MLALALFLACSSDPQLPASPTPAPQAAAPTTHAAAPVADRVQVSDARVRAMPPGSPATGAFMTFTLSGGPPAAVVGAASPQAGTVELHTHAPGPDGTMQMRQVERFDLDPAAPTVLKPGGLHVMLIGPTQDMVAGAEVSLTLRFDDGSEQALTVPVQEIQVGGMDHGSMDHGGMDHGGMDHGGMDHGSMEHGSTEHGGH